MTIPPLIPPAELPHSSPYVGRPPFRFVVNPDVAAVLTEHFGGELPEIFAVSEPLPSGPGAAGLIDAELRRCQEVS